MPTDIFILKSGRPYWERRYRAADTRSTGLPVFAPGEKCRDLNPDESTDVRVARKLGLDALGFQLLTPMTPLLESKPDGTYGIKGGLLRPDNLAEFKKGMPDVDDETLYAEAEDFVKRYKGEFALFCRIRLGFSPYADQHRAEGLHIPCEDGA